MFKAPNPGGLIGNPASPYCQISFQQEGLFAHMTTGLWFVFKVVDLMISAFCCFLLRKKKKNKPWLIVIFGTTKPPWLLVNFLVDHKEGEGETGIKRKLTRTTFVFPVPLKSIRRWVITASDYSLGGDRCYRALFAETVWQVALFTK